MRRPLTERNFHALLSAHFLPDRSAYIDSIALLLLSALIFAEFVLLCILFVLFGVPDKFWRALVQYWPQLLLILVGGTPDAVHMQGVNYILICFVFLSAMGAFCLFVKKVLRDLRGLLAFSRAEASQLPPYPVSKLLRASLPRWLHLRVIDAPSPTSVLDLVQEVQEKESTAAAWNREVATALEDSQKEAPPAIRIRLSLAEKLTIILREPDGKQVSCTLQNPAWVPLLVYLAIQNPGEWIRRDILLQQVYGATDNSKYSLLKMHIPRIHEFLIETAKPEGLLTWSVEDKDGVPRQITVIEECGRGKERAWRLSSYCEVEICAKLESAYERVKAVSERGKSLDLTREELNRICQSAKLEYGKGLMAGYEGLIEMWHWLQKLHKIYRDMCLFVLAYVARSERLYTDSPDLTPEEHAEAMSQAAMYYGWYAIVADGIFPKNEGGEKALQECLRIYHDLKDIMAAQLVYYEYEKQMRAKDFDWSLSSTTVKIWPEVIDRSRKRRKINE